MTTTIQIEQAFLSGLMTVEDQHVESVRDIVTVHDFSIPGHDMLYQSILSAYDNSRGKDRTATFILTQAAKIPAETEHGISTALTQMEALGINGDYIESIKSAWVSEQAIMDYAHHIASAAERRRYKEAASTIYKLADSDDPEFAAKSNNIWSKATEPRGIESVITGEELTDSIWRGIQQVDPMPITSVLSGMQPIDFYSAGFGAKRYYLIAAPPHDGKSLFGLNAVLGAAYYSNAIVIFFPYEQQAVEIQCASISYFTGGNFPWILEGVPEPASRLPIHKERVIELRLDRNLVMADYKMRRQMGYKVNFVEPTQEEMLELENAKSHVRRLSIMFKESPATMSEMRQIVRFTARKNKGRHIIAVLDYIQLAANGELDKRQQLNMISNEVKRSAMQDGDMVTWVVMAQYNRGNGTNNLKGGVEWSTKPRQIMQTNALAESPALEQDPDFIIFLLQNPRYMNHKDIEALGVDGMEYILMTWSVMKNRIMTRLGDGELFIYRGNGFISHNPKLDLTASYASVDN